MTLLGDAAHLMYPNGSNGATQAIIDAQVLSKCLLEYPSNISLALEAYQTARLPATAKVVMDNRAYGPEGYADCT